MARYATLSGVGIELFVFDFDGTLAHRPGMWSQCLFDVLDTHLPGHGVDVAELRVHLHDGFPWHAPDTPHPELGEPDAWWAQIGDLVTRAYRSVGVDPSDALPLPRLVRQHYCDAAVFQLYDDTVVALEAVRTARARSIILSNHVPELAAIIRDLGLDPLIDEVFSSAVTGYEKPHPDAFRQALGGIDPLRACMIGDNPVADKTGAESVGMTAMLVRHRAADHATVLDAVRSVLGGGPQ